MPLYQPAPPIRQGAPDVNLLSSAQQLPAEVRDYDRWRSGLTHRETVGVVAEARALCGTGEWGAPVSDAAQPEFSPFQLAAIHGCDGKVDEAQYRREALDALDAKASTLIASELWNGSVGTGNPTLRSTATTPAGTTALPVAFAIPALVGIYGAQSMGLQATIHMPASAVSIFAYLQQVVRVGNQLRTIDGHLVVTDAGYQSTGAVGPAGETISAESTSTWLFVSGPIELALGPVDVVEVNGGVAARQNRYDVYATRQTIYRFDTGKVFAVKVDLAG